MNDISGDSKETDLSQMSLMMVSLGCPKNLVDSESMCRLVEEADLRLVFDPSQANIIVINTCGFIESAKKEAIDKILEMADYKKPGSSCDFLIVAGCLAQRYSKEIQELIPEVDAILGTAFYGSIVETIRDLYNGNNEFPIIKVGEAGSIDHLSPERIPSTKGYAYIKIAEGCSNFCSFCAIPGIRGRFQSRTMESIVAEAENLAKAGIYELVLIAQDTTRYGTDIYGRLALPELLRRISEISGIRAIRILYCYADGITDELISEIRDNPKVMKYIEMPIQHANDEILKRMNRRDTKHKIGSVVKSLRKAIPEIVIRSTVMVGFPGETDEEFRDMLDFIKKIKFDLLGCFIFSPEEGTPAFKMKPKISKRIANQRYSDIMATQKEIIKQKNNKKINEKYLVTIESITEDGLFYLGRSYGQAPEIDPMIMVIASAERDTGTVTSDDKQLLEIGKQYNVRIIETSEYELIGVTL